MMHSILMKNFEKNISDLVVMDSIVEEMKSEKENIKLLIGKIKGAKVVHRPGIEPGSSRWQRPIVPLDHSRCIDGLHNLFALIVRGKCKIIDFQLMKVS